MELSIVLFILKIIILYIFIPCLLLASIFSLIYTFIITYHDKKNKDMVKVTCETMYCDKENKNRSIAGTAVKKIYMQGFNGPDIIIDYEGNNDGTYYFGDDGNIYQIAGGEDISWKGPSYDPDSDLAGIINFLGTISKETFDNYKTLCNFKIGDVVYVSDLDKMFIYNGSNLIEIDNDRYDYYLKKKKSMKSSINYNDLTDKDYKESDLLDNINKEIDQIINGEI